MYASKNNFFSISTAFFTLFILLFAVYFSYHIFNGDRGLLALMQLKKKVDEAHMQLDITKAERLKLEHDVRLMSDDSLDLDMLDEQARKLLGFANQKETVYSLDK